MTMFLRGTHKPVTVELPGDPPKPTCSYFGSVGLTEYHFVPAGNGRLKAISKAIGFTHDKEGAKTVWKDIPEDRQFEVPTP